MINLLNPLIRSIEWAHRNQTVAKRSVCALRSCSGTVPFWQRLLRRQTGVFLHEHFYCRVQCMETALMGQIMQLQARASSEQPANRIPLGLLMVARGKITHVEARAALEAQRRACYGTIGDWIEKLGFASEQDVTAALALQWGCPVASSFDHALVDSRGDIPLRILEAYQMVPFNYAASTNTLYLAFGARVDHGALYAIERILDCRTQACVASGKSVARELDYLRQFGRQSDVEFVTGDLAEMARITSSYIARLSPLDIRLGRVGVFIWLRLKGRFCLTNLLFRMQPHVPQVGRSRAMDTMAGKALHGNGRTVRQRTYEEQAYARSNG